MAWRAWLPDRRPRLEESLLLGLLLALVGTAARVALTEPLGHNLPFITYFPTLIAAAIWGGFAGGLACLVFSTGAASLLFLPGSGIATGWAFAVYWISGGLLAVAGAAMADTVRELKTSRARLSAAQGELQTLVGELAHRNRNALAVIMSIVTQSARHAESAADAERIVNARLDAMARAQEVLVRVEGGPAPARTLLEQVLEPFDLRRFAFDDGPDLTLPPAVATGLGLLIHELATNAVKYGSLSTPAGRVRLGWTSDEQVVRLKWVESGGPPVIPSARKGFGTRLLDAALAPHGGRAERRFEPSGVICELLIPRMEEARGGPGRVGFPTLPSREAVL